MSGGNLDKAFDIVRQQPALPVEVASKLGLDSFLAKAFLDQLVETGKLKMTSEKVSGVPVYFIAGQEIMADSKIKKLLGIKPTARTFASTVPQSPALEQKRADFKARLEEIEKKEAELKKSKDIKIAIKAQVKVKDFVKPRAEIQVAKPELNEVQRGPAKPKVSLGKEEPKPAPVAKEVEVAKPQAAEMPSETKEIQEKPSIEAQVVKAVKKLITGAASPAIELTLSQLNSAGAEILSKEIIKRGKEASIVAKIPSSIGPLQFLVIVQSKKTITKDDLSLAYAAGVDKKLPVLLYSPGKLAKPAQNYLETISGVVKFKQLVG